MAKIRIVGDSSGYVELAASNAAGNNTLELPSNATKLVGADASNNLNVTGIATFSSGIVVSTGTTTAPSISPSGDNNTGIFFPSADTVCIGEGGSEVLRVDSSGRVGVGTNRVTRPFEVWAGTAGTSFSVDSSGRVLMPYQPCFQAAGNQSTTFASQVVPFNVSLTNNGGHYSTSNYRFTAPIAGHYFFTLHAILGPEPANNTALANIRRNGTIIASMHRNTSNVNFSWEQGACSAIVYLNVSDYVDCNITAGTIYCGANITGGEVYSAFNGHLIG